MKLCGTNCHAEKVNVPDQRSTLRAVVILLIACAVLYFVIGGAFAWFGWFPVHIYAFIGGIVGSLTSTVGLISLTRPGFSQADLDYIEIQSLKKIAETSEEIKNLEEARAVTKEQIESLEDQKLLVQKASLCLFLQEQRRIYARRIQEEISKNEVLESNISELNSIDKKLEALNEQIENDPNVDLLKTMITAARKLPEGVESDFSEFPPFSRVLFLVEREIAKSIRNLLKKRV